MKMIIVKCDGCEHSIEVLEERHNDQFCVLALCEECAKRPCNDSPYTGGDAHDVVGKRV